MTPTGDPRCPTHPSAECYLTFQRKGCPPIWSCAICHRPLGAASTEAYRIGRMSPRGRRPKQSDLRYRGLDWNWFDRDDDDEEVA
jgi:hypothetical protein